MSSLSVVYDLTDYTAVMAVCIVLTVVLAAIIVAMAVMSYVKSGRLSEGTFVVPAASSDGSGDAPDDTAAAVTPAVDRSLLPVFFDELCAGMPSADREKFALLIAGEEKPANLRYREPLTSYDTEKEFLKDTFLSFDALGGQLPTAAAEELFSEYVAMLRSPAAITRINYKMVRFYFARRKSEEDALGKCIRLCKKDIGFNFDKFDVAGRKVPSLKRLILIYTAQKKYLEALNLCDEAISREVLERKDEGYEERRARILGKLRREEEKAAAKAAKAAEREEARKARAAERAAAKKARAAAAEKAAAEAAASVTKDSAGESDNGGAV